ncbi:unnamed protein product, partial [Closterium sp. Yama58-4]
VHQVGGRGAECLARVNPPRDNPLRCCAGQGMGSAGKMLPIFQLFAGGPLGTGQQWRVAIWWHLRVFYAHVAMRAQLISAPSGQGSSALSAHCSHDGVSIAQRPRDRTCPDGQTCMPVPHHASFAAACHPPGCGGSAVSILPPPLLLMHRMATPLHSIRVYSCLLAH